MKPVASLAAFLLLACGPKAGPDAPTPVVEAPGPAAPVEVVPVTNPEEICRDAEHDRTVFVLDLGFAEGCGPIPSEYGGQVSDVEIAFVDDPPRPEIAEPVDFTKVDFTWASAGCGAIVHFTGPVGALDLRFASTGGREAAGTGTWTPAGGAPCALTVSGTYSDYQARDPDEASDEE